MSKLKISLIFLVLFITTSCSFGENKSERIYKTFFGNMEFFIMYKGVHKVGNTEGEIESERAIINDEDMDIIKKEMSDIKEIKEDYADAFGYKKGYRAMFIDDNLNTPNFLVALYSIEKRTFVVRECDVYPERKVDYPEVKVYTFKMTNKVAEILKKYEQTLPANGSYFHTWPLDY